MKKYLLTTSIGVVTLLCATTSFAAGKSNEKFTTLDKGSIIVKGSATSAYDKKGNWVYTIERYAADNLPKNIFDIVRKNYGSYYISGMEKVEQPGFETVYLVHMQNETTVKTVKVSGTETELVEDYIKG